MGECALLAAQRRDLLLGRLERDGRLVAKDLAAELRVTEDSVRRDLRDLAAAGLCQRVYGGALPVSPAIADYDSRRTVGNAEQAAGGNGCLRTDPAREHCHHRRWHHRSGGGRHLAARSQCDRGDPQSDGRHRALGPSHGGGLLVGRSTLQHSAVTCGAAAAEAAQSIHADVFLLGVTGVHPETGLTTGDPDEAAMKRALAARAADIYVLASSEKIGAASPFTVLPLSTVTGIITDAAADHPTLIELRRAGTSVITANA